MIFEGRLPHKSLLHYCNSWFFQLDFLIKKYPKVIDVKKSPCQFGQVVLVISSAIGQPN
jgi:hypothetical protein